MPIIHNLILPTLPNASFPLLPQFLLFPPSKFTTSYAEIYNRLQNKPKMTQYASSSSQAFLDSQLSPISQSAFRTTKHHCDGPGCKATFSNLVEFEAHREDPSVPHEWCDKCKEWCKDWDDFVKHKATSSDHLSCPNCGKDFKSVGGIELHLKQV